MKPIIFNISINQQEATGIKEIVGKEFEMVSVVSGAEALALYKTIYMTIRVVLVDLSITDMDGLELIKELRKISALPEYIVVSEQNHLELAIQAMKQGAYDYITKPIDPKILLHSLNNAKSFVDALKRIEKNFSEEFLVNIEKRMELIKELVQERRSEGKIATDEELLSFFSSQETEGLVKGKKITELIKSDLCADTIESMPKILVVDDEEEMRDALSDVLSLRYDIVLAEDGEGAIEKIKQNPDVDLVLLDIGLPGISGIDLMPKLQAIIPGLEIIMLTAFDDIETVVKSFRKQAFTYITKPYNPEDLFIEIAKALQKRCFTKTFPNVGRKRLSCDLSEAKKIKMIDTIAKHRESEGTDLLMEDVYVFFPQFKESGLEPTEKISSEVLHDGISYFIDHLKRAISL